MFKWLANLKEALATAVRDGVLLGLERAGVHVEGKIETIDVEVKEPENGRKRLAGVKGRG